MNCKHGTRSNNVKSLLQLVKGELAGKSTADAEALRKA
jgi:hypothetical protein